MARRLPDWRGRTVLVTGGSRGIGRAIAERVSREGARVALLARDEARLREVAAGLEGEARVYPCDVTDREAQATSIATAERELGPIDVAVLNAGVGLHRELLEHSVEEAERVLDVNVRGVLYGAHPLARAMAARGHGWLVFMASIAGLVPVPGEAVYSASKHAVLGLADALSIELEPRGVHVMTVCPGAVATDFVAADEADRVPRVARATEISAERVADATLAGLRRGARRVVVPRALGVAVALRGAAPGIVREGTKRATR